jgi:hypothetical protein
MSTLTPSGIRTTLGRVLSGPFSFLLPGLFVLATPAVVSGEPLPKNAWDIAVIDRALAGVKPGQKMVPFGDVGMKPAALKAFRQRLLDEQTGSIEAPAPAFDTPPGTAFKWPGGIIAYRFDPTQVSNGTITAAKMQQFRDGIAEWAAFANVHFNEFTGAPPTNYVTVQENASISGGFSSSVGMAGGEQFVQFGPLAWNRGTVCHEVGHAIGLYHEQQRDDRDSFVVILTQNIIPGQEGNFAKLPGGSTAQGAYDFYSVMHYARNALSIDPDHLDTIEPQPAYSQFLDIMGQVWYRTLSKLDRAGMAVVYGNPSPLPSAVVINTSDSGSGSLRAALYYAFDKSTDIPPVPTTVVFNIPVTDPGFANNVFTIKPTYMLVAPGAGTTIDGSTQTSFTGNTNPSGPEVVLDGSQVPDEELFLFAPGFYLIEANCAVKNLVINNFNQQGILIVGTSATGNIVTGCYLGTNATGTGAVPNFFPGVEIAEGANGNTIGGTNAAARNIISGNAFIGLSIHDSGSNNNIVRGNYIGTNAAGTAAIPNAYQGIEIFGGAQNNTIGGTTAGARNVISGNTFEGVSVLEAGTNGNLIQGNYIGLNAAGTAALPNNTTGVNIVGGAQNNTIGSGSSAGGRNVISGNIFQGIVIADSGTNSNKVQGNIIGLNAAGTVAIPNQFEGVAIFGSASSNTIGGTTAVSPNIISGNIGSGISISGTNTKLNKVQHNLIGTNLAGTAAFPNNGGVGIFGGATSNTIGGSTASTGNVISGNNFQGVTISGTGTKSNTVAGNFIGTNNAGTAALPNTGAGISIFGGAQSNIIGGATAASRNVISGNMFQGVTISDSGTKSNQVLSNYIGLNAAGTAAIPNQSSGIDVFNAAASNIIGDVGKGNVISGNLAYGMSLSVTGTSTNTVKANLIGLNATATAGIGNAFSGVALFNGAKSNTIGGPGAGNTIAFNGTGGFFAGIDVYDNTTFGNDFNANSIYSNVNLGINLNRNDGAFGVTANDAGDADSGPNQLQNYPVLTAAHSSAVIQGSLNSVANKPYRIDFFSSPAADPSGFGEGQTWIGAVNVTTDGSGNAAFNQDFPGSLTVGSVVTATATGTGSGGSGTSEFSAAITVVP